jgi:hypothetical protein
MVLYKKVRTRTKVSKMGKKAPCKDKKCSARGVYFLKKNE